MKSADRSRRLAYRGDVPATAPAPRPHAGVPAAARPRATAAVVLGLVVARVAAAGVWATWRVFVGT